jgi:ABC-type oligopeptide transport system substrate-binding subunit
LLEEWQPAKHIFLNRNPNYHGPFTGNVDRIEGYFISGDRLISWFEEDRLDCAFPVLMNPVDAERARNKFSSDYLSLPALNTVILAFDTTRPPFDNPDARQAFALATDKEYFTQVLNRGFGREANGGLVPPGMPGHSKGIGRPYDVEQARKMLARAGYPDGRRFPVIDFAAATGTGITNDPAAWLSAQWQELLGVTINLQQVTMADAYYHLQEETPHMWIMGWLADYPDQDNFLRIADWRSLSGWTHETYERIVEDARRVADEETRMAMYRQAELILVEETAVVPISYGRFHVLVKPWVKHFNMAPLLGVYNQDIVIEPHE